jgi:DNA-directed RNA polymerase subunit K/omega
LEENEKEMESQESTEEEVQDQDEEVEEQEEKAEEREVGVKKFPSNKYELAIVAAQEARRMNEAWKDQEETESRRVTDVALERVKKGEVRYTFEDNKGR